MDNILVFDERAATDRIEGDLELFSELVAIFLEEYPKQLSEVCTAGEQGDAYAVNRSAHAIKSALGNLGAMKAFAAALALEIAGKEERIADLKQLHKDLELEVQEFVEVLGDSLKKYDDWKDFLM